MTRFQSQRKQKNTMNLSTKQKQHLKGLAHPLKPQKLCLATMV